MNDSNKHIDKLFEDSLGQYTVEPNEGSWLKIANGLDSIARINKRKYLKWVAISSVAVAILAYIIFLKSCTVGASSESYYQKDRLVIFNGSSKIKRKNTLPNFEIQRNGILQSKKNTPRYLANRSDYNTDEKLTNNKLKTKAEKEVSSAPIHSHTSFEVKNSIVSESLKEYKIDEKIASDIGHKTNSFNLRTPNSSISPIKSNSLKIDTSYAEEANIVSASINTPPPGPEIATSLELEFGMGLMNLSNNFAPHITYENPLLQSTPDKAIPTIEGILQIKYKISNFYCKSGIRFSDYGENTVFNLKTEMHDTSGGYQSWNLSRYWTYDTIGFYDDPNNPNLFYPILSPTYHIDTLGAQWNSKDVTYYNKTNVKVKNRYRYIEIPLIVGYQQTFNRLGVFVDGGIGIGMMVNSRGSFVSDGDLQQMSYSNNPYKNFNFNYLINIGANYTLTNQWNVFIQASIKSNITSIYKDQSSKGINYSSKGVQFGMSYNLK